MQEIGEQGVASGGQREASPSPIPAYVDDPIKPRPRGLVGYSGQTSGRDFVRDSLLMTYGEIGRESERQAAINHFFEMRRRRNGAIEQDYYDAVKSAWGPDAVVGTHPTWWPYPDRREFKKNGLDWWIAPRDWAQTDEKTPSCVRTSLAKKWDSPVWYNMYYSPEVADYQAELWANALTGGRVDYHQLWSAALRGTRSQFVDGTHIIVSGIEEASGGPIQQTINVDGQAVSVDAVGLVGIRMGQQGQVEALAAGGLRSLKAGDFSIELPERVDPAIWRDEQGKFKGVLQGHKGPVPAQLAEVVVPPRPDHAVALDRQTVPAARGDQHDIRHRSRNWHRR